MNSFLPNPHHGNIKNLVHRFASSDKSGFDAQAVVAHPLHDDPVLDHELKGMLITCANAAQSSIAAIARIEKDRANPDGWEETFDEEDGPEHMDPSPASFGAFGDVTLGMHTTILDMVKGFLESVDQMIIHSAKEPEPGEPGYDLHSWKWWNDAKELNKQIDQLATRRKAISEVSTSAYAMQRLSAAEMPAPAQIQDGLADSGHSLR